jgi:hypothetical protein
MVTTPENDWQHQEPSQPWMQKTRPGLRTIRPSLSGQAEPVPGGDCAPTNPVNVEKVMPANLRINRLLREAHEAERQNFTNDDGDLVLIVAAILALAIYWGAAAFAANSALTPSGDAMPKTLTLKYAKPMGGSSAAINAQNHSTESAKRPSSSAQ